MKAVKAVMTTIAIVAVAGCNDDGNNNDWYTEVNTTMRTAESLGDELKVDEIHTMDDVFDLQYRGYISPTPEEFEHKTVYTYKDARYTLKGGDASYVSVDDIATTLYGLNEHLDRLSYLLGYKDKDEILYSMNYDRKFGHMRNRNDDLIVNVLNHDINNHLDGGTLIVSPELLDYLHEDPRYIESVQKTALLSCFIMGGDYYSQFCLEDQNRYGFEALGYLRRRDIELEYGAYFSEAGNDFEAWYCDSTSDYEYCSKDAQLFDSYLTSLRGEGSKHFLRATFSPWLCPWCGQYSNEDVGLQFPSGIYNAEIYPRATMAHELVHLLTFAPMNENKAMYYFGWMNEGIAEALAWRFKEDWGFLASASQETIDGAFEYRTEDYPLSALFPRYMMSGFTLDESKERHEKFIEYIKNVRRHSSDAHKELFDDMKFTDHKGNVMTADRFQADIKSLAQELVDSGKASSYISYAERKFPNP